MNYDLVSYICSINNTPMGLLNQQGKKGDKKSGNKGQKNNGQQSKFINKGSKPAGGGMSKKMTGGSQRGS
jgi:hypothetical protein